MSSPIIVGLALRDDDAAPLALARRLARLGDSPLLLATALPREAPARFPTPEYSRTIRAQAEEKLHAAARELGGDGVATRILDGSPAGELHHLADQVGAAAIVVGSSHRGAVGRLLVGDIGVGLLHGSTCPVVIVPRGYEGADDLRNVGVAFDGTPESRAALEAAIGLARRAEGTVHSFTVLEPLQWSPSYAWPGPYPSEEIDESRQEWAQTVADQALEAIPEGMTGASEVLHGAVVASLAGASSELDLLVCGSRGYGGTRQVLAGSVARGLAHAAGCPLVVVPREASVAGSSLWRPVSSIEAT